MLIHMKHLITLESEHIFNGDLKLDNIVYDNFYNVHFIDNDCCIFLDPKKEFFKIKGYTEGYASKIHIESFEK